MMLPRWGSCLRSSSIVLSVGVGAKTEAGGSEFKVGAQTEGNEENEDQKGIFRGRVRVTLLERW